MVIKPAKLLNGSRTPAKEPTKSDLINAGRVQTSILMRFNPIRQLTPERLGIQLEMMVRGYLSQIMRTWEAMERRDDRIASVSSKAKSSLARHGFQVIPIDDSPQAMEHKAALDYFWNNCSCVDTYCEDNQGKFAKLVRTMANAIGFGFAAHEIIWQPSASGLTAQFRYAPPWFFENTQGRLRFLTGDWNYYGIEMDRLNWLVTAGDGLGIDESGSVAYMFKHMPLNAWVNFCDKFGLPAILGKTNASQGSPQWNALVDALKNFSNDFAGVCGLQDTIEQIKIDRAGESPFSSLIEKMDKAITILWRGADLGTQSHGGGGKGQGASVQADETDSLDQDRAMLLSECLQLQIDTRVIWYTFGDDKPLAKTVLKTAPKLNITEDIATLTALVPLGVPFTVEQVLTRRGWPMPEGTDGSKLLTPPPTPQKPAPGEQIPNTRSGRNPILTLDGSKEFRKFLANMRLLFAAAQAKDLAPLREALSNVLQGDDVELKARIEKLDKQLPSIADKVIKASHSADQLTTILNAALLSQLAQ